MEAWRGLLVVKDDEVTTRLPLRDFALRREARAVGLRSRLPRRA